MTADLLAGAGAGAGAAVAVAASAGAGGKSALVPSVSVRLNNVPLPSPVTADLVAVSVSDSLDSPAMFTLQLVSWDARRSRLTWADDALFAPGAAVAIAMGYQGREQPLLSGQITALELEYAAGQTPMLTVRGYDARHRLNGPRRTRSFAQMTDADIFRQVASPAGLAIEVEATTVRHEQVFQHNQTDLEFLLERARRIGFELLVDGPTLRIRGRRPAGPPAVTLKRDEDVIEFTPRLSTAGQVNAVEVRGWDVKAKQAIVGQAKAAGAAGEKAVSVSEPVSSKAEADQLAAGQLAAARRDDVSGAGLCIGNPAVRAGATVSLDGFGTRFGGRYDVVSAEHRFAAGRGYRTSFEVERSAK